MRVLGYNGGLEVIHENLYNFPIGRDHDSAIVLVEDGEVIFAIEEERLNRIKHTNKFPSQSLRLSLKSRDIQLEEVDLIVCCASSKYYEMMLKYLFLNNAPLPTIDPTIFIQHVFCRGLNSKIDSHKICFVTHHYAHAMSALAFSGYESSLVTTFDGSGDDSSGIVFEGKGTMLKQISCSAFKLQSKNNQTLVGWASRPPRRCNLNARQLSRLSYLEISW